MNGAKIPVHTSYMGVFRKLCQQKSISFIVINSGFKMNVELQINIVPRHDRLTPVFSDVFKGDKDEFFKGVLGGEGPFGFGYFSQLTVEAFDRVSGVNEAADLGAKVEHSPQALPVAPPVCDGRGVFFAPFSLQLVQGSKGGSFVGGLIDMLEVCAKRAVVLVTEVLNGVAYLVNPTPFRSGKSPKHLFYPPYRCQWPHRPSH